MEKKKRILLIEDDAPLSFLLLSILKKEYDIVVKNDGMEAWSWLSHFHSTDLIISDLNIPSLTGLELLENISNSVMLRSIPIIVLSGNQDPETKKECFALGIVAYILKPFDPDEFLRIVKKAVVSTINDPTDLKKLQSHFEIHRRAVKLNTSKSYILRVDHYPSDPLYDYVQDDFHFCKVSEAEAIEYVKSSRTVDAILLDPQCTPPNVSSIRDIAKQKKIPLFIDTAKFEQSAKEAVTKFGIDDYHYGVITTSLLKRIDSIKTLKAYQNEQRKIIDTKTPAIKYPVTKRIFDIIVSFTALLLLSPLLFLIAIGIKFESKGPIFYVSKRAGAAYKIFNFYKFRTMRLGADKQLQTLANLNQYNKDSSENVFFKLNNDPRVTKFGAFLRKTSLDEIPQLLNVLKGDMSLVGNRPLPLYEAMQLTKDQIAWRFLAPAGITGLWQITKRGKDDISPEERIVIDMEYAIKSSFWLDFKIILKTLPAMLQRRKRT